MIKEIKKLEKKILPISLKIAKEKQKLVQECFKILKIATIKTEQNFDDEKITNQLYNIIKKIDNEKIKEILKHKENNRKKAENKVIKIIINSIKN